MLAFLRHLEQVGFAGAPRVVGSGFASDGREMVSYIDGSSPQPFAWAEDVVGEVGRLLRDLHAAAATFVPAPDACWRPWFGRELPGSRRVIGHCDTGPWNNDDIAERCQLPGPVARARQLRLILDGYGLPRRDRDDFTDKMIAFAIHDARAEAVRAGITPDTTRATTLDGYPSAWAVTWRARSASWILTHRAMLQRAIS